MTQNPLLERNKLPDYSKIKVEHIEPAVMETIGRSLKAFEQIEKNIPQGWALIDAINEIEYDFSRTFGPVGHLMGVQNSDELRKVFEKVQPEIVKFSLRMEQSPQIFKALKQMQQNQNDLNYAKKRALMLRIRNAEHAGIGLDEKKRQRFNEIVNDLSKKSTKFSNHVMDATKEFYIDLFDQIQIEGLPKSLLAMASNAYQSHHKDGKSSPEKGPWRITLDIPSYLPFMQHAKNRDLREKLYKAYVQRASSGDINNLPLISEILKLRKEMASLLGFSNYARLSLDSKMAEDPDEVFALMNQLKDASLESSKQDFNELKKIAAENGFSGQLMHWDMAFWSERLREKKFRFNDEDLRPYFGLEKVLEGLFELSTRLFNITIEPAPGKATVWHDDVRYFIIKDAFGNEMASFYLDPYSRPENKRGGAWMNDCIDRRKVQGSIELPVAYLVCNSTPPVGDIPSLMTFREVETLFHEFGHGLQHMLTQVDEYDVSGISGIDWDAVELPSQFMENWCYHKPTLQGLSSHYKTGEKLPDDLFDKITSARTFMSASAMLRQLRFSLLDLELHTSFDSSSSAEKIIELQRQMEKKTSFLEPLEEDRFLCSFAHIFAGGYAAGYYSYKWAEVLSADAFSAFEEKGLDSEEAIRETGIRFKQTILSMGGSKHPMEVFQEFRGRKPKIDALLKHSGLLEN